MDSTAQLLEAVVTELARAGVDVGVAERMRMMVATGVAGLLGAERERAATILDERHKGIVISPDRPEALRLHDEGFVAALEWAAGEIRAAK